MGHVTCSALYVCTMMNTALLSALGSAVLGTQHQRDFLAAVATVAACAIHGGWSASTQCALNPITLIACHAVRYGSVADRRA